MAVVKKMMTIFNWKQRRWRREPRQGLASGDAALLLEKPSCLLLSVGRHAHGMYTSCTQFIHDMHTQHPRHAHAPIVVRPEWERRTGSAARLGEEVIG